MTAEEIARHELGLFEKVKAARVETPEIEDDCAPMASYYRGDRQVAIVQLMGDQHECIVAAAMGVFGFSATAVVVLADTSYTMEDADSGEPITAGSSLSSHCQMRDGTWAIVDRQYLIREGRVEWLDLHVPHETEGPWSDALRMALSAPTLAEQSLLSEKYIDLEESAAELARDQATTAALMRQGQVVMLPMGEGP